MKTVKFTLCSDDSNSDFMEPIFYQTDEKKIYLNASSYQKQFSEAQADKNIEDFQKQFSFQLDSLCLAVETPREDLLVLDEATGNVMLDERAEYLLLHYLDASFGAYMYARMRELFAFGFTVSDKVITSGAKQRFGIDI